MGRYTWVVFDVDDTLLDYQLASRDALQESFSAHSLSYKPEYHQLFLNIDSKLWNLFQEGKLTSQEVVVKRFEELGEKLDLSMDPQSFSKSYAIGLSNNVHVIPGAIDVLENLNNRFNLVAATNGVASVQRKKFSKANLGDYFKQICISESIGYSKPNVEFFRYLHSAIGSPDLSSMIIVGDSLSSDILGGNRFGIDTCWFNRHGTENDGKIIPTFEISDIYELCNLI